MPQSPRLLRPSATGFNPKSIAGLSLWLDASDSSTITLNGSNVSEWRDKSGYGSPSASQSTAASQPAYTASAINGRPGVSFELTESLVFQGSTASFNYLHNATGATIFVAFLPDAASNPDAIRYLFNNTNNSSANTGLAIFIDDRSSVSRNNALVASVNRGVSGQSTSTIAANNFFSSLVAATVLSVTLDNANATAANRLIARLNGTATATVNSLTNAAAATNASLNMTIGNFGGGGLTGALSEILFYQGVLSSSQRSAVERYLGKKYGVTVA
jgi:hypothetical protein